MIRYNGGKVVIVLVLLLMVPLLSTVSCTFAGGTTILKLEKTQTTEMGTLDIDGNGHTVSSTIILACRVQEKVSLAQSLRSHNSCATKDVLEKLSTPLHLEDIPFLHAGLIKRSMLTLSMSDNAQDIIYVDDDADPSWYDETHVRTIQEGIAHASDEYTVFVHTGMYVEHVVIDKTISLIGEDKHNTIIDGSGEDDVVFIASGSDGVVVSGFTIQNSGNYTDEYREDAGVDIHASNCDISNNIIINHPLYGIKLTLVNNNVIKENEISHSGYQDYLIGSISLFFSHDNNISQNVITNNNGDGIDLRMSNRNVVMENTISSNFVGLTLWDIGGTCTDNIIYRNDIKDNRDGINIRRSGNTFYQNNFINNSNAHALSLPFALSRDFKFFTKNTWEENYWDDWIGLHSPVFSFLPKYILFGLDFDWHPASTPYSITGGCHH